MLITLPVVRWLEISESDHVLPVVRRILSGRLPWMQKTMSVDTTVDPKWFESITQYVQTLTPDALLTLYVYTSQDYAFIQDFLDGRRLYVKELVIPANLATAPPSFWSVDSFARSWTRAGVLERYGLSKAMAQAIRTHLTKMNLIQSEEDNQLWIEQWNQLLGIARQYFSPVFWKNARKACVKESWKWHSHFAWAARSCSGCTRPKTALSKFKAIYPTLTATDWQKIFSQYVKDLDAVFAFAPPLPKPLMVFRGTSRKTRRWSRGYISTTLIKSVAQDFQGSNGCCLHQLHVKTGARVLPLCMLSRYWGEMEMLLPRGSIRS